LRKCGLVHEVTEDMFLRYAEQVASSGKSQISERVQTQSTVLLKHLFCDEQFSILRTTTFLRELRTVAFIVPHCVGSVRENLCLQYGKRNSDGGLCLVEFANSIRSTYADAVWK